ncbi:unnamed protein product [Gongylonema pulchrum]|uniref:ETS domain-containing protein n=1 Tax=Gongylonema pulchrum TaxID=637853 RepID=A0A183EPD0_9BILA|nr:unnamed protein product [Gongylonema pulchrum]
MEDVIAWLLHIAKLNGIPFEDLEVQKFAYCTGIDLMQMGEADFIARDTVYGSLIYNEFRKFLAEEKVTDKWVPAYKPQEEEASTSALPEDIRASCIGDGLPSSTSVLSSLLISDNTPIASSSDMQSSVSPSQVGTSIASSSDFGSPDGTSGRCPQFKVRKNKDGKPRKHSQHTKGNKLWEFIRDALKDPSTCPSIVRWEDPVEGVFRIVESEKLARLWGEKKNNQKMTYEKLSRAMR